MKVSVEEKVSFQSNTVPNRSETDYVSFIEEINDLSKFSDKLMIIDIIDVLDARKLLKNMDMYLDNCMTYELKIKKLLD